MQEVKTLQDIKNHINTAMPVLIYFSGQNCSICKVLKPKINDSISKNFPKMTLLEVKTDEHKEITAYFTVFSLPTILVYFDTKEFFRIGRNISIASFVQDLKRPYNLLLQDVENIEDLENLDKAK